MHEENIESGILIAALADEARPAAGEHPGVDQLLDYHGGRLEPDAAAQVRAHLVACRACTRRLLEIEPFTDAEVSGAVADLTTETSLRRLEARIRDDQGKARWSNSGLFQIAAAALIIVAVGLGARVAQLQGDVTGLRQVVAKLEAPAINPSLVYLGTPGTRQEARVVALPAGKPSWVLVVSPDLGLDRDRPWPEYEVVLRGADGEEIWRQRGLEPTDAGSVTLVLTRQMLPAGEALLEIHGLDQDQRFPAGEHRLRGPSE